MCLRCALRKPADLDDANYSRMRPTNIERDKAGYYRCSATLRGYEPCGQRNINVKSLDHQLVEMLSNLVLPADVSDRIERAVSSRSENETNLKRIAELEEKSKRVNISWEEGLLDREQYVERHGEIRREISALRPVDYDELNEAADFIRNFRTYWDACEALDNPAEARKELVAEIVETVYVYDKHIAAVVLHGDYAVILGGIETAHAQIARAAQNHLAERGIVTTSISSRSGDDGARYGSGCSWLYVIPKRNTAGVYCSHPLKRMVS